MRVEVAMRLAAGLVSGNTSKFDQTAKDAVRAYFEVYDVLETVDKERATERQTEEPRDTLL